MTNSQDQYIYRLCQTCRNFLEWDRLRLGRLEENTFFIHYPTASYLKDSASKRCHLCLLIYDNLLKSRWPQGEIELPQRHIRLTIKYPVIDDRRLYLNASIAPANISTAGLHELSQVDSRKVTRIITSHFDKGVQLLSGPLASEQKKRGTQELVTVEDLSSDRRKYFKGGVEIVAAEFYAAALPFHSCDLHLQTVSPAIDAILTKSMSNDDKSTSSASALCMADFWRQICRQKHEHCISANKNHNKPPILPKRVLDVANPSLSGPLLFCPPPGFRARYVTLSHCWGEKRLIRTLRSNISKWITGIPLAEIPKTFLDACDITSKLGYQYLWIDSLCIIQDSTEDWRDESTKMADIYSNADLCISALDSHDSSEGIYRSRDGLLHRPCRLWDEAPPGLCILQFSGLPIYAFADPSPPSSSTGPLAHRAWVLQEELMSGRRLIYGKNILYWSCLTMQVSTSEPDDFSAVGDTRFNNYLGWRQYFQEAIAKLRGTDVISRSDMENLYQCWLLVIENYSQRGLSRGSDKLTALAGVASEFGRITQDSFLSGLWSRFLWRQLLWSVASKGAPPFNREVPPKSIEPRLVPDFLGPTWSWSKIDGHIRYFHQYPLDKMGDHEVLVEILCSRCSPSSPKEISNNYSGVLSLRGFLAKAIAKPFSPGSKRIVMHDGLLESPQPTKEKIGQIKSRVDTLAKEIPIYPGDARPLGETASVDSSDLSQLPWSIDSSQYGSGFDNEIHSPGFSLIPKREFPVIQNLRDPIYPGHPVINFDGEQVGLWAPDLPSAQETVEIICLAISSNRQFVFCIGMELVNRYQNRYRRVGLIFWEKSAWATAAAETNKSLIELE